MTYNARVLNVQQIGCFKIGSMVYRGKGKRALRIMNFMRGEGQNVGQTFALLGRNRTTYDLTELALAGPNGERE